MSTEKVVISGIGGCFPSCNDLEEFKEALYEKTNLIIDLTSDWTGDLKVPSHVGRINDLWNFDHTFLSINLPQAQTMDKTCKSFLKCGYACILDAGYSPSEVRGQNVGCYMHATLCEDETRNAVGIASNKVNNPILVGVARTMHANRISAYFDFHGTSVSHQSPFEGAFNTMKMAYDDVVAGRVKAALVGVSSFCVNPQTSLEYQALGLLTDDPINRPLDDNASGYVRADATVVIYLQKESEARRNYGQIINIGSCYCGDRLGTFLSRNENHIIKLLEDTYRECGLKPCDISYLETGSWANKDLDTQELKVIRKVFSEGRSDPLLIGSVVGNTGFCEGAAAFVSLVKCILALRSGVVAPTLHVKKPNALIDEKMKIVTENTPCQEYVAINSFGLSGNFAHIILRKPENKPRPKYPLQDDLPRLYFMAARKIEDADILFNKLDSTAKSKYLAATMCDVFRKEIRGYMARCYAVHPYKKNKIQHAETYDNNRPVWFLFSGMGSQWQAMGKDLMKFPVFANTIAKCSAVLKEEDVDLMNILTNEEEKTIFDNILNSFVGIASIQIALVDILFAMGIKPDGVIGHSVGELGCAYADGSITAEQALLIALERGKASIKATLINGMMAAVGLGQSEVRPYLPPDIEVACHNSSTSCTLSGPAESVQQFVNILIQKGVFAKAVNVSNIAYHSRYIKPAAPLLLEGLKKVIPHPKERSSKWVSTSIEEHNWNSDLAKYASAEYFTNNLLSAVYFEEGAHHIPKNAILIEIAPHGLLQAIVKKSLDNKTIHIAMTNRSKSVDKIEYFLEAIGQLYINGCDPDVNAIYPNIEYPIPANTPSITQFMSWDCSITSNKGLESGVDKTWSKTVSLGICSKPKYQHLLGHKIGGRFVIPIATYIDLLLDFFMKKNPKAKSIAIENLRTFDLDTSVFLKEKAEISISLTKLTGIFEITLERDQSKSVFDLHTILATGEIKVLEEVTPNIPEWKTKIGILQFDAYLKILKYSVPEDPCVGYVTKYLEGLTTEILSNGRIFDLIDNCLKLVVIERSEHKKPEVPYYIKNLVFNVESVKEYKKGKSVQVYYDPTTNYIVSSAVVMNKVKTKKFILDNPEPAKEYSGPVSYFTSMNIAKLENVDVNYVGIASQLYSCESIVDYSGVTSSGNKIMGIVSYVGSRIDFDKVLQWTAPSSWNLDTAVTVPLVYSMAYLCLVKHKSCYRTEKMKSVFIQCGDTALGEACIALALHMKKTVYTTVGSEEGRTVILKRFSQLSPNHVFLNTNYNYFLALMLATDGKGVDVVVNTLKDEKHMNICWESMQMNGELIQVGVEETQSLCMRNFLNSQSFISLNSSMLLNCNEATKKDMHAFIDEGIKNGTVKPIVAKIAIANAQQETWGQDKDVSYNVISLNKRQTSHSPILNVNPDSSYGIVGGMEAHYILEWLMQRGARKFVMEFSSDFKATRMSPLLEKYGAILMVSRNNTSTLHGTEAFLADVRSFGEVAGVFAVNLSGEECKTKLDNIKKVCDNLKSNTFMANLLSYETRNWHFEIKADSLKNISQILSTLDDSLKNMSKYTVPSEIGGSIQSCSTKVPNIIDPRQLLDAHLPFKNLRDMQDQYSEVSEIETPRFEEERSQSLKKDITRNVLPIFCFPALFMNSMRQLIRRLMYPSFLAHIPAGWSIDDIVAFLYKSLKEVQPEGHYTFVTESWSGIFALKLAEHLEKRGEKVTVILLDASPYLLKGFVLQNKEIFSTAMNLASYIMQKEGTLLDVEKKTIVEQSCKVVLDRVRHNMETELNHVFKSQCILVTSDQSSWNIEIQDQYKMFKAISGICVTTVTSPFEFSSDRGVIRFINENIPVSWW